MRSLLMTATLLSALSGCQCCLERHMESCPPQAPQAEVQETKEVEVHAPRQKIVVEMPNRTTACQAPCPSAASCQPQAPAAPAAAPTVPTVPMMGYGHQGVTTGRLMGIGFMTMPVTGIPPVPPTAAPFGPNLAMAPQAPAGVANMSISGNMTVTQALMMLIASGALSQEQVTQILRILGQPPQTPTGGASLTQPGAQAQLQPQQIASLLAALAAANSVSGSPAATPTPNAATSSAGSAAAADNASSAPSQQAPGTGSGAPAPSSIPQSLASFHEQLRQAEQRLRELEQYAGQSQQ